MKQLYILMTLFSSSLMASVVGISTHPLNQNARVISAEMIGFMSRRHELAMGLRYTQELPNGTLVDLSASGGQDSRGLISGGGMDIKVLSEEIYQPRVSFKPFFQYQKFESQSASLVGVAPTMRKGFSASGVEVFPFLAFPTGIKIDTESNAFVYHSSLTFGASLPFPTSNNFILSLEGNRDFGASSDYVGALVSWAWK